VKQQQQQQPQENNMDVEVEGETEGARAPLDEEMLKDVRFPLTLGNGELVVEALGEIIADHPLYHDNNYIFPVGYRWGCMNECSICLTDCEMCEGGGVRSLFFVLG